MYSPKTEPGQSLQALVIDISNNVDNFFSANYSHGVDTLQSLIDTTGKTLALYLAVWIAIEGYKIAWGNGKQSVQNFMFDTTIKFIFIVLAMNIGNWINIVYNAFDGVKEYINTSLSHDGKGLYSKVAAWAGYVGDFYEGVWKESGKFELIGYIFIIFATFIGYLIGTVPILRALFVNTLSFLLLMILAPLAFYFLIFKSTKNSFAQWFQMVLANVITLLCLSIFLNILFNYIFPKIDVLHKFYEEAFAIMFQTIFYGILANVMCGIATGIAEKITNVSLDGLAGSGVGRAMGLAGAMSGAAIGGVALGAKGVQMLGAGKALQGVANFIGSRTAGTAKSTAQLISNSQIGKNTGQVINNGINAAKNSQIGQKMGAGFETARKIGSKINNFTKGGE